MYTCEITHSEAVDIAVAEIRVAMQEVPAHIPGLLERVANYLVEQGQAPGACYVVYDEFAETTMRMRAGFVVQETIQESEEISVMRLAASTTAHTTHYGSYDGIPGAHQALREYCTSNNYDEQDLSWEIYGEWSEDESKLVTDVHVVVSQ